MKKKITQPINLTEKLKPYENKWVALSLDYRQVLSSGKTLKETIEKLKKDKDQVVFMKVLPFDMGYVPTTL